MLYDFHKNKDSDTIWWSSEVGMVGRPVFSFDKKEVFYLFRDYPGKLTAKQKEIFDKENPYWANALKNRSLGGSNGEN